MPQISTRISVIDAMTPAITAMYRGTSQLVSGMYELNRATGNAFDMSAFNEAQSSFAEALNIQKQIADEYRTIEDRTNSAVSAQRSYNSALARGTTTATAMGNNLISGLRRYISLAAGIYAGKELTEASDTYKSNVARLELITESPAESIDLQQLIYKRSQDARGSYNDSINSVAKLGLLAGESFNSNYEAVRFAELMQKSFKLSGASTQERQSAMYQLTQAMAAGKLQGDEFRSIMENAPMLAQSIADYTGKTKGELKDMSADGEITADIIKNALFSAADDIESKFSTLPITFGETWTMIGNEATMAFAPVYEQMNGLLNSDLGRGFANGISDEIDFAGKKVQEMIQYNELLIQSHSEGFNEIRNLLESIISEYTRYDGVIQNVEGNLLSAFTSAGVQKSLWLVANNFAYIAENVSGLLRVMSPVLPLITSVYVGFANYRMLSGIFSPIVNGAQSLIEVMGSSRTRLIEVKEKLETTRMSTQGLTTAMQGATTAAQGETVAMQGTTTAIQGATAAQQTFNIVSAANVILGVVSAVLALKTAWESSAISVGNYTRAFRQAKEEAEALASGAEYYSMASTEVAEYAQRKNIDIETAQSVVNSNAQYQAGIDAQFRMLDEYKRELENVQSNYTSGRLRSGNITYEELKHQEEEVQNKIDATHAAIISLREAQRKKESEIITNASTQANLETPAANIEIPAIELPNLAADDNDPVDVKVVNTVDIASEDLRYMRELAEREAINEFTSKLVQPNINVTFGEVKETADVDGILSRVTDGIIESLNNSSDLVHI